MRTAGSRLSGLARTGSQHAHRRGGLLCGTRPEGHRAQSPRLTLHPAKAYDAERGKRGWTAILTMPRLVYLRDKTREDLLALQEQTQRELKWYEAALRIASTVLGERGQ